MNHTLFQPPKKEGFHSSCGVTSYFLQTALARHKGDRGTIKEKSSRISIYDRPSYKMYLALMFSISFMTIYRK